MGKHNWKTNKRFNGGGFESIRRNAGIISGDSVLKAVMRGRRQYRRQVDEERKAAGLPSINWVKKDRLDSAKGVLVRTRKPVTLAPNGKVK